MTLTYLEMIKSLEMVMRKTIGKLSLLTQYVIFNDDGFHIKSKYGFIRWCQAYGIKGYLERKRQKKKRHQAKRIGRKRF